MQATRRSAILAVFVVLALCNEGKAGGGPENVLLVVNPSSEASMTIANHYIRMRDIPSLNVMYLKWDGSRRLIGGKVFCEKILQPIVDTIEKRKLAAQIDYVVYSADFPWLVDFQPVFKGEGLAKQFRPLASLTGATYLWTYSLSKNPALVMPTVNWYVMPADRRNQIVCQDCSHTPTWGFRSSRLITKDGKRTTDREKGQSYLLSTMLGVTVERGNTEAEILNYLGLAVAADATHPNGTFYFMTNDDVRSKARHNCFPAVARELQAEGAKVALLNGEVPDAADKAVGIMTGIDSFSLDSNNVHIAPGAICEHFTSSGAIFNGMYQTKLSAWLRAGAAGSSGTVAEPYAIQAKFPLPSMQLHYHRGASLAEAFYQSISGPYQLLIVGDPLCQPWAKPPSVEVEGISPNQVVSDTLEIKAKVAPQPGTKPGLCELFVDGRLVARYPHTLPVPLDTSSLGPGRHELRLVVATADRLEFRGSCVVPFRVPALDDDGTADRDSPIVSIDVAPEPMVTAGARITVTVKGPVDAEAIDILQNHRRVGRVEGNAGSVEIDTRELGRGPVSLVAQVSSSTESTEIDPAKASRSEAFWFLVR